MDSFELARILYIESWGNYVIKHHSDGRPKQIQRSTIKDVERSYCISTLVRIHKRYIVNLKYVRSVEKVNGVYAITLKGEAEVLPISKSYLPSFQRQYDLLTEPVVFVQNDPGYQFL